MARKARLALTETQTYPSGIVMLSYDVIRDAAGHARRPTRR